MVWTGPSLGAVVHHDGASFRVFSSVAEQVDLCLHAADGREASRHPMVRDEQGVWSHFEPGLTQGQLYGYRVHGPWNPDAGLRCNPHQLLLDPFARRWAGEFHWTAAVFDYVADAGLDHWERDQRDSAPYVPRSVLTNAPVCAAESAPQGLEKRRPWAEQVIYEANVRGFTMRHPALSESQRGRFQGLSNGQIVAYLKSLGITAIELQPVQAWIDEAFLVDKGLRNYWGYNSLGFFAPDNRLGLDDPVGEFREMVQTIHAAGLEVYLDVAYNHTGESGALGPTLSFRGLDNLAYYRVEPDDPAVYINDTGCGNTVNMDHPQVQAMVLDSLRYWHQSMGVDGFRFDLAPILGRTVEGFTSNHPLLHRIATDTELSAAHLIAEPWDPGPGGYQLGEFPGRWAEWNDQYRDTMRAFWRSDPVDLRQLAGALGGSAHLFEGESKNPAASVNFITAHDGYTLHDLVSYEHKHNAANGEDNRDGHDHNLSSNHGSEGPSENPKIRALRRRHRLNLLASLLLSRGVPMLLAGDELGQSQRGNNNAYAQDNEITWIDWDLLEDNSEFVDQVRELVHFRRRCWALIQQHGNHTSNESLQWLQPNGDPMDDEGWAGGKALQLRIDGTHSVGDSTNALAILINGHDREVDFHFANAERWQLELCTDGTVGETVEAQWRMPAWSVACLSLKTA